MILIGNQNQKNKLKKFGYNERVVNDEIQAYLSTETNREHIINLFGWPKNVRIPQNFKKFFNQFDLSHK
jgi:hypothetical protein